MKINKEFCLKLMLTVLIVFCISCITLYGATYQQTIEEHEAVITENINTIEQLEQIKTQLHITAEMLRNYEEVNNNFDELLSEKWHECDVKQSILSAENINIQSQIEDLCVRQDSKVYIGDFTVYHYCPNKCCGTGTGKTASGTQATPNRTIAIDPKIIPLGSQVEINGQIYIAEDTGGAIKGNKIDICVATHQEALNKGIIKNASVYVLSD